MKTEQCGDDENGRRNGKSGETTNARQQHSVCPQQHIHTEQRHNDSMRRRASRTATAAARASEHLLLLFSFIVDPNSYRHH